MSLKTRLAYFASAALLVASSLPFTAIFGSNQANAATTINNSLEPSLEKSIVDNGDGTHTITLDITGKNSSTTTTKRANVVIVFDASGSMTEITNTNTCSRNRYGAYGRRNGNYIQLYYRDGDDYLRVNNNTVHESVLYINGDYMPYNGNRYSCENRLNIAQDTTKNLAENLLSKNTSDTPDAVEIAFIEFASTANDAKGPTTNLSTMQNWISETSANGGTNWNDALNKAINVNFNDNDPAHIVFISDGNPTFYMDDSGLRGCGHEEGYLSERYCANRREDRRDGNTDGATNIQNSYNAAAEEAKKIAANNDISFYGIGVFGNVNRMQNLTTAANGAYYSATDSAALNTAFSNIASSITTENSVTYTKLSLVDPITTYTGTKKIGEFQYQRNNEPWTPADNQKAEFKDGNVTWGLGETTLGADDKLTLSFVVYPDQSAVDHVADAKNNGTDCALDDIITSDCTLKTNGEWPTLSYEADGISGKVTTENPAPIEIPVSTIDIQKIWQDNGNTKNLRSKEDIVLTLLQDSGYYKDFNLSVSGNNTWNADNKAIVAPGLMVSESSKAFDANNFIEFNGQKYTILNEGHDYQLAEPNTSNYYRFSSEAYHPMYLNGTLFNVTFDDDGNIKAMSEMTEFVFTGTNIIKPMGDLEITKTVEGTDAEKTFTFTFTLEGSSDFFNYCTLDEADANGERACVSTSGKTIASGESFQITAGDTIRIRDLPAGAHYTITETDIPAGYSLSENDKSGIIVENDTQNVEFVNIYSLAPTTAKIQARKDFGNNAAKDNFWLDGETFTFALKKDGNTIDEKPALKGQNVDFTTDAITEAGATHYVIEEVALNDFRPGVSNVTNNIKVTVCAVDNGEGKLLTSVYYGDHIDCANSTESNEDIATIRNDYDSNAATGKAEIVAYKILRNYDFTKLPNSAIEFTLTDESGNETTARLQNCDYLNSDQRDSICEAIFVLDYDLDDLDYTASRNNGYAKEFRYEIAETKSPDYLTIEDATPLSVTVTVSYDAKNPQELKTDVYFANRRNRIYNNYQILDDDSANINIPVTKILEGRDWLDSDEFVFTLEKIDSDESSTASATKDAQTAEFALSYDLDDLFENRGVHHYRISEKDSYANIENGAGIVFRVELWTNYSGKLYAVIVEAARESAEECENTPSMRSTVSSNIALICPDSWLDRDEEFTITNTYTAPVEQDDTTPKTVDIKNPHTSDHLTSYLSVLTISALALCATAYIAKRQLASAKAKK